MQSQPPAVRACLSRRTAFASTDELDDLLGLATSTNSGREVQQPAMAPIVVPAAPVPAPMPTSLNELFDYYRNYQEKIVALAVDLRKIEAHLFGEHWDTVINTPETKASVDIAYLAMENLIKQAEQMYAPPGGALAINRAEVWRALGIDERRHWRGVDRDASVPFDLARLHAHLADTYAGDAGETAAYRQQAAELIKFFRFVDSGAMATSKRHVACTVPIYSRHKDYAPKGTLEVSHNERIGKSFQALACAMAWAGLKDLQSGLSRTELTGYCFTFKSRHREVFPGLSIVLYKDKWTFEFDHKVAEQLRLFLGQYGA